MAYHGYIPACKNFLYSLDRPRVLEIGVDKGTTFLTLATFLLRTKEKFDLVGIDIMVQDHLRIILNYLDKTNSDQVISLLEENSLKQLNTFCTQNQKFDLILIDGDHNYFTVQNELKRLNDLASDNSLVIIDDYEGRWSTKDLWYVNRPEYFNCTLASLQHPTEKHGVKPAVDEFLEQNSDWFSYKLMPGEPILLTKNKLEFHEKQ